MLMWGFILDFSYSSAIRGGGCRRTSRKVKGATARSDGNVWAERRK
jgi:hypothetical protein